MCNLKSAKCCWNCSYSKYWVDCECVDMKCNHPNDPKKDIEPDNICENWACLI